MTGAASGSRCGETIGKLSRKLILSYYYNRFCWSLCKLSGWNQITCLLPFFSPLNTFMVELLDSTVCSRTIETTKILFSIQTMTESILIWPSFWAFHIVFLYFYQIINIFLSLSISSIMEVWWETLIVLFCIGIEKIFMEIEYNFYFSRLKEINNAPDRHCNCRYSNN